MSHYDRTKSIKFNYYNNLATPSNLENHVHYQYKGKENQQNVVFINSGKIQSYTANDLYIFKNGENDGELLIEHKPITNYGKKLLLSFPLVSNSSSRPTAIDNLINNKQTQEVELNKLLPNDTSCTIKENMEGIQLNFISPINIKSNLSNLYGNPTSQPETVIEGNTGLTNLELTEKIALLEGESAGGYRIECTEVDVDSTEAQDALYRIPVKNKQLENNQFIYYFFVFLLVLGGSYGGVGFLYWYALKSTFKNPDSFTKQNAKGIIRTVDGLVALFVGISLAVTGPKTSPMHNPEWFTWSWVILIVYGFGALFIYFTPSIPIPNKIKEEKAQELTNLGEIYFWSWIETAERTASTMKKSMS